MGLDDESIDSCMTPRKVEVHEVVRVVAINWRRMNNELKEG